MIVMTGDPEVPTAYRAELVQIISALLLLNRSTSGMEGCSARDQPTEPSGSLGSSESGADSP